MGHPVVRPQPNSGRPRGWTDHDTAARLAIAASMGKGAPTRTSRTYGSILRFTFTALGKGISAIAEQSYDAVSHINNTGNLVSCRSAHTTNNRGIHAASRWKCKTAFITTEMKQQLCR